jgi:predicted secreted protein
MSGMMRQSFDDTSPAQETEILGGTDQTKIGNIGDRLKVDSSGVTLTTAESELPTFTVHLTSIATANGKSMASLVNAIGSSVKLKLRELRIINTQNTPVTGVVINLNLRRCTDHSGGTSFTPLAYDTTDSLSGSITARTGATITAESASSLRRWTFSTDEWNSGAQDVESMDHIIQVTFPAYYPVPKTRPLTLNANEGFTLKCETNTTTGIFDILCIFTQE